MEKETVTISAINWFDIGYQIVIFVLIIFGIIFLTKIIFKEYRVNKSKKIIELENRIESLEKQLNKYN